MEQPRPKRYDILYASGDKAWFEWIYQTLKITGGFQLSPKPSAVSEAIHANQLDFVLFLVSRESIQFVSFQDSKMRDWRKYYAKDPTGFDHFFIPVKLEEVDTTHFFEPIKPVKLYGLDDINDVRNTLLNAVSMARQKDITTPFPGKHAIVPGEIVQAGRENLVDPSDLKQYVHPNDGMSGYCTACGSHVRYRKGKTTYRVWFHMPDFNENRKQLGWVITCPLDGQDVYIELPGVGRGYV